MFTVLGLDGLGRWSRNNPPTRLLNSANCLPVTDAGQKMISHPFLDAIVQTSGNLMSGLTTCWSSSI